MRFQDRKRRQPPAVIIVSLIDILIVLLIFLMVTTTFRQEPAVRLALPTSAQARPGASESALVVTVAKTEPHFYLGPLPITLDRLKEEFLAAKTRQPKVSLTIRGDSESTWGDMLRVMDTAKAAGISPVNAVVRRNGKP